MKHEEEAAFVAATTYTISATLYAPDGRPIGRLERGWAGGSVIAEMTMMLLDNSKARPDLDNCHIEIRWWKDGQISGVNAVKVPERHAHDNEERGEGNAPREAGQEGLVNDERQA